MRKANHASHIYTATTAATEYFQSQTSTENLQLSMGEKNGAGHQTFKVSTTTELLLDLHATMNDLVRAIESEDSPRGDD
jgi:hypothetical protein